jgi:hypothetical protein
MGLRPEEKGTAGNARGRELSLHREVTSQRRTDMPNCKQY